MKSVADRNTILNEYSELLSDESKFTLGTPQKIFFPESPDDISEILREASISATPVILCGARTGITGGAVPVENCILISFSKMNKILECVWEDGTPVLTCQPGVTLTEIRSFLQDPSKWPYEVKGDLPVAEEFFYPPDPTELTAQLGGTAATNASGARSFFYGATRDHISSLQLVLPTGHIEHLERSKNKFSTVKLEKSGIEFDPPHYSMPDVKNATGYYSSSKPDPVDLFIGSEGTLAVFSKIGIRLSRRPRIIAGLCFLPSRNASFNFADFLRTQKNVAAIEYFDSSTLELLKNSKFSHLSSLPDFPENMSCALFWELIEDEGISFENLFEQWEKQLNTHGSSFDLSWSGFEPNELAKLKAIRHAVPESINLLMTQNKQSCPAVRKISTDSALPSLYFRPWFNRCISALEKENLRYAVFGHIGDYHLHINILPGNETELSKSINLYNSFMYDAVSKGGTLSAEHGIGKLKSDLLEKFYPKNVLNEMRRIKNVFDSKWLLNRGTLLEKKAHQ
ncbi:D-lactate dehydrogenase [Chitinispirillum alkaliphilum]|nr:D-lactate dehydrogenase [Chitinispirillum alkaliphilum]